MSPCLFLRAFAASILVAACAGPACLAAAAGDAPLESRLLFGPATAAGWSAAESAMQPSTARSRAGRPALHWHVQVDYQTGEVNYPIGWPRVSHALPEGGRDWSDWEYLQMWIYVDTSRESLPREPVGLGVQAPDKASGFQQPLAELRKGEWVKISIPVAQLPRGGADVRQLQFHIAESKYRHGDTLDLYIDDLCLVRHSAPVLAGFAAECAVMFRDAASLPVRFQVLGVKCNERAAVSCELRRDGRAAARGAWQVGRGAQRCVLDLKGNRLPLGDCELVASIAGGPPKPLARLRVVESPWEDNRKEAGK